MMTVAQQNGANATADAEQLAVINPITQEIIGHIPVTDAQAVADATERARFAQKTWGSLRVAERTYFIRQWLDLLWERQSEGIRTLRAENGKADGSAFIELLAADSVGQYYIHNAAKILKPQRRRALLPFVQTTKVYHKPVGVVGIISPWNYPFALPFMDMIPALIAGNTVILKPSEITPFVAQWGVDLMHEAGIPRDVVQIVHGDGRTGAALVETVDFIQFTGSTEVGRQVGKRAAERLIPYSLELGGNDPSIVLADADPDMTAIGLMQGAFENSGQMCISIERVYVEAGIYDQLLERLQYHAKDLTISSGDGMDVVVGSMTNRTELERTQAHIQDALDKGARVLVGGKARPDIGPLFHEPTILVDVDHSMTIMHEETFGPVMPIMKVQNVQEAIRLANDTSYGLSASVFSRDLRRAEEIALKIDSGDVNINRAHFAAVGTPSLPTGGQKNSGTGRRNGPEGLLKYTASQAILADTLIGADQSLVVATPFIRQAIAVLRIIRRYVPFI